MRRRYGRSLVRSDFQAGEDVNPNAYITNVGDCMLVLVLGLLVALIARFNIDLQQIPEDKPEIVGIEVNMDANEDGIIDDTYSKRGSVYYDEESGSYYFVSE